MTTNLILSGLVILSLVWKNLSDNKRTDKDKTKIEGLIGASAVYEKKEELMMKKIKQCEDIIAGKDIRIEELDQTITDLTTKLKMQEGR